MFRGSKSLMSAAAVAAMLTGSAHAAVYNWVGSTSNAQAQGDPLRDWTNLNNWSVGGNTPLALPGINDDVVFPAAGTGANVDIPSATTYQLNSIAWTGGWTFNEMTGTYASELQVTSYIQGSGSGTGLFEQKVVMTGTNPELRGLGSRPTFNPGGAQAINTFTWDGTAMGPTAKLKIIGDADFTGEGTVLYGNVDFEANANSSVYVRFGGNTTAGTYQGLRTAPGYTWTFLDNAGGTGVVGLWFGQMKTDQYQVAQPFPNPPLNVDALPVTLDLQANGFRHFYSQLNQGVGQYTRFRGEVKLTGANLEFDMGGASNNKYYFFGPVTGTGGIVMLNQGSATAAVSMDDPANATGRFAVIENANNTFTGPVVINRHTLGLSGNIPHAKITIGGGTQQSGLWVPALLKGVNGTGVIEFHDTEIIQVLKNGTLDFDTGMFFDLSGLTPSINPIVLVDYSASVTGSEVAPQVLNFNNLTWTNNWVVTNDTLTKQIVATLIPEPGSLALLGLAGLAMVARRRR